MAEKMGCYVYVKGLVGVRINRKDFHWSFGSKAPMASQEDYESCKIKIQLSVVKDSLVSQPQGQERKQGNFRYFHAIPNTGSLYYERRICGIPLRFALTVKDGSINGVVGRSYYRLVKLKLMNLHPIWYILFDLCTVLLLREGILPLYAASFALKGTGGLIMGPPNIGKTLTALLLAEDPRVSLLGEDIAMSDGEMLWPVPWTHTYRDYGSAVRKDGCRGHFSSVTVPLKDLFLLERDGEDGAPEGRGEEKLLLLQQYGIGWHSSPAVSVLCYFNDSFSMKELLERERELLDQIIRKAAPRVLRAQSPLDYAPEVLKSAD